MATEFHHHLHFRWVTMALLLAATATQAGRPRMLVAYPAPAAPPPFQPKPNATDQFLAVHNQARAAVKVAALLWSQKLTDEAGRVVRNQKIQKRCAFADLQNSSYGANQAWTSYPVSPAEAVQTWVAQGRYYNYGINSCAAGRECGTYTQVVWRRTTEVGCAQASCAKDTLTVCLYFPHGNVRGQKPY